MTDTSKSDLTIVFYSINETPKEFAQIVEKQLKKAAEGLEIIAVTRKMMDFATRGVIVDYPASHFNIYKQALIGAYQAKTKYIALCEDDTLYSPAHFKYRPKHKPFAYNLGYWGIYTWQDPPIYNYKGRKNLGNLICDREAFIEAMEERFTKHSNPTDDIKDIWAEPSKYERQLGVTVRESEDFYTNPPNIKFSHENELSFKALGKRKRAGELRATEIDYWKRASDVRALYK